MSNPPASSQDKILYQIKRLGPLPAKALAEQLGMTTMGIRQHLAQLEAEGLIVAGDPVPQKRGRPVASWSLTDKGHGRFPDAHAQVTVELISGVRDLLGEAALEQVIDARAKESLAHYERELAGLKSLRQRIGKLAALRTDEGYIAEVEELSPHRFRLVEQHCPICIAARTCQGFCRAELETFQLVFRGMASVSREDYLIDGARRCSYLISANR